MATVGGAPAAGSPAEAVTQATGFVFPGRPPTPARSGVDSGSLAPVSCFQAGEAQESWSLSVSRALTRPGVAVAVALPPPDRVKASELTPQSHTATPTAATNATCQQPREDTGTARESQLPPAPADFRSAGAGTGAPCRKARTYDDRRARTRMRSPYRDRACIDCATAGRAARKDACMRAACHIQ